MSGSSPAARARVAATKLTAFARFRKSDLHDARARPTLRRIFPSTTPENAMVTSNSELAYNTKIEGDVVVSRADAVINWIRNNSMWPMPMGLACCAIELMAVAASRFDIARFGAEVMRFSPRQSDCMIVAGTGTFQKGPPPAPVFGPEGAPQ